MFRSRILSLGFFFNNASIRSLAVTDKCDGTCKENRSYRKGILNVALYMLMHTDRARKSSCVLKKI
jgi:hypothetical protein